MTFDSITFEIDGEAVPQGRPRFTKNGHAYDPEKSREYKEQVALAAKRAMMDKEIFAKPTALKCAITFWQRIPKSFNKKQRQEAENDKLLPTVKPDVDNVAKAITDAMNGIVYEDDAQIVTLVCAKYYATEPFAVVTVKPVREG